MVVILVICVIGILTLYMGLLMLLDSWFRRGRTTLAAGSRWNYQEQTNEVSEHGFRHPMPLYTLYSLFVQVIR